MRSTHTEFGTQFVDAGEREHYYTEADDNLQGFPFVRAMADDVAQRGGDVLDVGCGSGAFGRMLSGRCRYWGGDYEQQANLAELDSFSDFKLFHLDACDRFPLDEESFDSVVSFWCLEHLLKPEVMLRECVRMLKPAGELILVFPNYDDPCHRSPSYWCDRSEDDSLTFALKSRSPRRMITQCMRRTGYFLRQIGRLLRISVDRRHQSFWINHDPAIRYLPWSRDRDAIHIVCGVSVERLLRELGMRIGMSSRPVVSGIPLIDSFLNRSPEYIIRAVRLA